jgi:SAM-dependent methyltransferase
MPSLHDHDVRLGFASLDAWRAYALANSWACNPAFAAQIAAAAQHGVYSRFHGFADSVTVTGENWRETIVAHGLNSRARAVLDEFADVPASAHILMLEAVTPFALAMRSRFPFAIGTEYLPTEADRRRFYPIPHCDITASDLPDTSFDYIVSNDVLEHVPDVAAALSESRRILKPGGACLATFPFAGGQNETIVKARLENGAIVHLTEPEYHGNPVDPQGSLVFAIPGWDVLDACRAAGFDSAEMVFVSSTVRGITGSDCAGVFILRAQA